MIESNNLNDFLIEYDTKNSKGEYYKLPKGTLLQLIFIGDNDIPFCTLRKYTPKKYDYYIGSIGNIFAIETIDISKERDS